YQGRTKSSLQQAPAPDAHVLIDQTHKPLPVGIARAVRTWKWHIRSRTFAQNQHLLVLRIPIVLRPCVRGGRGWGICADRVLGNPASDGIVSDTAPHPSCETRPEPDQC